MSYRVSRARPSSGQRSVVVVVWTVVLVIVVIALVYGLHVVRHMVAAQPEDPTLDRYPEVRLVKGVVSGAGAAGEAFRQSKGRYPTSLAELTGAGYSHDPRVGVYVGKPHSPETFCVQGYYGQLGARDTWTYSYSSVGGRPGNITLGPCPG